MRRRFALLWTMAVLGAALALPATTAAGSSTTYTVQDNKCSSSGGAYGYGKMRFQVRLDEYGNSGANKFTFQASVMHRNLGSSYWSKEYSFGKFTYTFPDNGSSYWYSRFWTYQPDHYAWHKFKIVLKVLDGSYVIASKTLYGKQC